MKLDDAIEQIVFNSSGGIKFTELITNIADMYYDKKSIDMDHSPTADEILVAIKQSKTLKILEYTWHMSDSVSREKMFVYTP